MYGYLKVIVPSAMSCDVIPDLKTAANWCASKQDLDALCSIRTDVDKTTIASFVYNANGALTKH